MHAYLFLDHSFVTLTAIASRRVLRLKIDGDAIISCMVQMAELQLDC